MILSNISALMLAGFLGLMVPLTCRGEVEKIETNLLIVGATESGWAAAIQAARMGVERITIVHDGKWFGGQYTEQALACVDENKGPGKVGWGVDWHPMKRSFHRSGLFKELMDGIEAQNTEKYGDPMPGRPYHGPSTFRPAEAEQVFRKIIQPYIDSGQVKVCWNRYPVSAGVEEGTNRLQSVGFASLGEKPVSLLVTAKITIDASDWGEVIQVAGAEYEVGPDPQSRYGEPSASEEVIKNEMNPITWAMIVEESPKGEFSPIAKPGNFDDRNYPRATGFSREAFQNLKWDRKAKSGSIPHWPDGGAAKSSPRQLSVYSVRRIVDGYSSNDGKTSILLNYMNGQDYPLMRLPQRVVDELEKMEPGASQKNLVEMTREQREVIFDDSKRHSLGVLYHLQNFVHEKAPDKTNSFRRFRLSGEFGTGDNLPPKPYIRESLRLKAMYMMREQDGRNRDGKTKVTARERFSHVMYPDGLFAWQFHYDFHRTGRTYLEDEGTSGPWIDHETKGRNTRLISDRCVFPARSLVPVRMDGLLGAQGNVGFSSIVSAAIRLHDQRIHIGQASGAMAAVSLKNGVQARELVYNRPMLEEVRDGLCGGVDGVPLLLYPWRDLKPEDPDFVALNRLSMLGELEVNPREVDVGGLRKNAEQLWAEVQKRGKPFPAAVEATADTDLDNIPDLEDALLFTPSEPIEWKIEAPETTPETDGLSDEMKGGLRFDFAAKSVRRVEGFKRDYGKKFSQEKGHGWSRDISANARHRNVFPERERDAFLFTREKDQWECEVENGKYEVTVCIGDSGHVQAGQFVTAEGVTLANDVSTAAGQFYERGAEVKVSDGRLTLEIGREVGGTNTALCWVIVVPIL